MPYPKGTRFKFHPLIPFGLIHVKHGEMGVVDEHQSHRGDYYYICGFGERKICVDFSEMRDIEYPPTCHQILSEDK